MWTQWPTMVLELATCRLSNCGAIPFFCNMGAANESEHYGKTSKKGKNNSIKNLSFFLSENCFRREKILPDEILGVDIMGNYRYWSLNLALLIAHKSDT